MNSGNGAAQGAGERPFVAPGTIWAILGAAAVIWIIIFLVPVGNFWLKMPLGVATLVLLGRWAVGPGLPPVEFTARDVVVGIVSALILYGIFWVGNILSGILFPFAPGEIADVYSRRTQAPTWVITLILMFVIGPGEELFWRGFLQNELGRHMGRWKGYLAATAAYTAVHVLALNFMLTVAALVGSAFWGYLYYRERRLGPVIISHAFWDLLMFVIAPVQ